MSRWKGLTGKASLCILGVLLTLSPAEAQLQGDGTLNLSESDLNTGIAPGMGAAGRQAGNVTLNAMGAIALAKGRTPDCLYVWQG